MWKTIPDPLEELLSAYYVPDTVQDFISESEEGEGLKGFSKRVSTNSPIYIKLDYVLRIHRKLEIGGKTQRRR